MDGRPHPDVKRRDGRLDGIALAQLAGWETVARAWRVAMARREDGRVHVVCSPCGTSVLPLSDQYEDWYVITPDTLIAALVAHLRIWHPLLEARAYAGKEDGSVAGTDNASAGVLPDSPDTTQ